MLTDHFSFLLPRNIERGLPARLRGLADDLERIRDGSAPTYGEIAKAPSIDRWRAMVTPLGLRLVGSVSGHPRLGSSVALISQIWAADGEGRWVRTLSRFYRLGKPDPSAPSREEEGLRDV
jgi:hypothetical protein